MDGAGSILLLGTLKALAFVYDILTFPVYLILQRPWTQKSLLKESQAIIVATESSQQKTDVSIDMTGNHYPNNDTSSKIIKAVPITKDTTSITYRSMKKPQHIHTTLVRENIDTMAKMFDFVTKKYPNKRCLGTRQILAEEDEVQPNGRVFKKYNMGDYKWKTYTEVNYYAEQFGSGIRALGCLSGQNVVIFAETREEWMIAAHGLFKQNIPLVTIYATLGEDAIAHGINETEVTTVITSFDLMPKFKKILDMTPKVNTLIYMEDQLKKLDTNGYKEGVKIVTFKDVVEKGTNTEVCSSRPTGNDTAIIMYTSGSTGVPKGVILRHKNLIATTKGFCDAIPVYETDVMIGFLPLAHVFELLTETVCLLSGIPIGYSNALTMIDSASKIKRGTKGDASVLQPTCMTSVPLILDRISKNIQEKVSKGTTVKKVLFKFAYDYKEKWTRRGYTTPIIDSIVFSQVRAILGGKIRVVFTGGAPLSPETHEQINICMCCTIVQGYGLTETTSSATVQSLYDRKFGRAGPTCTICDIKVENWEEGNYRVTDKPYPRGEIFVGGENISSGYYKLPEKTNEDFFEKDGRRWFKTGDICEVQELGIIKIIDRKKDLVKLQAGEYVSLGKVEAQLKINPLIDNICVYGDSSKHFCVALLVPNPQQLSEFAERNGISNKTFEELCQMPEIAKLVLKEIEDHGKKSKLEKFEIPAAVKLVTEVWSPDTGLVTAAFKLKRKDIEQHYKQEISKMYSS